MSLKRYVWVTAMAACVALLLCVAPAQAQRYGLERGFYALGHYGWNGANWRGYAPGHTYWTYRATPYGRVYGHYYWW